MAHIIRNTPVLKGKNAENFVENLLTKKTPSVAKQKTDGERCGVLTKHSNIQILNEHTFPKINRNTRYKEFHLRNKKERHRFNGFSLKRGEIVLYAKIGRYIFN